MMSNQLKIILTIMKYIGLFPHNVFLEKKMSSCPSSISRYVVGPVSPILLAYSIGMNIFKVSLLISWIASNNISKLYSDLDLFDTMAILIWNYWFLFCEMVIGISILVNHYKIAKSMNKLLKFTYLQDKPSKDNNCLGWRLLILPSISAILSFLATFMDIRQRQIPINLWIIVTFKNVNNTIFLIFFITLIHLLTGIQKTGFNVEFPTCKLDELDNSLNFLSMEKNNAINSKEYRKPQISFLMMNLKMQQELDFVIDASLNSIAAPVIFHLINNLVVGTLSLYFTIKSSTENAEEATSSSLILGINSLAFLWFLTTTPSSLSSAVSIHIL